MNNDPFSSEHDDLGFLGDDFNPTEEADSGGYTAVPPGRYSGIISRAEMAPTRTGGLMLKVGVKLTGPTHGGAWVWGNLNLKNASEVAQRIGRQQFGSLCVAAGFAKRRPASIDLFLEREVEVQVINEEYQGATTSKVKSFHPSSMAPPRSADALQSPAASAPKTAAPATGRNPWGA